MRNIKFRGKDKKTGEWLYGNLQVPTIEGVPYFMWDKEKFQREVDPNTIGQYTGVRDYNGNEVYEGDIITIVRIGKNISPSLVEWLDCGFIRRGIKNYNSHNMYYLSRADAEYFKVVGNIHDNKELLSF